MSKFDDVVWIDHFAGGLKGTLVVNDFRVSLLAGSGFYSDPRENLKDPEDFESFEIAVFNSNGDWATEEFFPEENDDVVGWQSREDINKLIEKIENHK